MVKNRVNELLKNCADAETISDFIDVRQNQEKFINFLFTIYIHISIFQGNVPEVDKSFINSLTTWLCKFAIVDPTSYKLDIGRFKSICEPLLLKYINSNKEFEVQCLCSVVSLVDDLEHPMSKLQGTFVIFN